MNCSRCGGQHTDKQRCPQCNNCKKWNYWGNLCKTKKVNEISDLCEELLIDCVENVDSDEIKCNIKKRTNCSMNYCLEILYRMMILVVEIKKHFSQIRPFLGSMPRFSMA